MFFGAVVLVVGLYTGRAETKSFSENQVSEIATEAAQSTARKITSRVLHSVNDNEDELQRCEHELSRYRHGLEQCRASNPFFMR